MSQFQTVSGGIAELKEPGSAPTVVLVAIVVV